MTYMFIVYIQNILETVSLDFGGLLFLILLLFKNRTK